MHKSLRHHPKVLRRHVEKCLDAFQRFAEDCPFRKNIVKDAKAPWGSPMRRKSVCARDSIECALLTCSIGSVGLPSGHSAWIPYGRRHHTHLK